MHDKVIHVLTHGTLDPSRLEYNFQNGWHAKLGKAIQSQSDLNVECWLPDYNNGRCDVTKGGIRYRTFRSYRLPKSQQVPSWNDISLQMLRAAIAEDDNDTIFHLHADTTPTTLILSNLLRNSPVFLHHHGGLQCLPKIDKKIPRWLRRAIYSGIDHEFVLTEEKREYICNLGFLSRKNVSVRTMGVDFDKYKPILGETVPEKSAHDYLLLFVGQYSARKGLDHILNAFNGLQQSNDIGLVLVGGSESDTLYDRAASNEAVYPITDWISNNQLIKYYNAADAFVSFPEKHTIIGGECGIISPVEALACETPVVSPVLRFFPSNERDKVGIYIEDNNYLQDSIASILTDSQKFDCRTTAQQYFSWEKVAEDVLEQYRTYRS
jgi:glycosyltransferase involved in cell wall biosynthesis